MINIKEIQILNKTNGELKSFKTLDEFKMFFTIYSAVLNSYVNITQNDENVFLDDLQSNWNCYAISKWSVVKVVKKRKNRNVKKAGNGAGSYFYSEVKKRHIYAYFVNKKRKVITQRKGESKTAFDLRVARIKSSIADGTYIEKSSESIHSILESYIFQKYKSGSVTGATYKRNCEYLKSLTNCLGETTAYKPIQNIIIDDIENSKEEMRNNYSDSVISKMWGLLKIAFKIAHSRKKIIFNIMEDVTLTKPKSITSKKHVEALTEQEEKKLIEILNTEEAGSKYKDIILFQLDCGARIGELCAISKKDIDLTANTVHIHRTLTVDENGNYYIQEYTKTYNQFENIDYGKRTLPLSPTMRSIILKIFSNKLSNAKKLLFWDYNNNDFIHYGSINSYLSRINKKYHICNGVLHTHRFRHTLATRLLEAGIPLPVRRAILGHSENSSMTDNVYSTVSLDLIKSEMEKLS